MNDTPNRAPLPRRGDVKRKMFKEIVVTIRSIFKPKHTQAPGFLTSNSTTPAVPSSGYNSDVPHEP
jgi:hypothetical protein